MPTYLFRINPPRPTFYMDMTEAERAVMRDHVAYWTQLLKDGRARVFGPVKDPKGAWSMGIVDAPDEAAAQAVRLNDPVTRAGLHHIEVLEMPYALTK